MRGVAIALACLFSLGLFLFRSFDVYRVGSPESFYRRQREIVHQSLYEFASTLYPIFNILWYNLQKLAFPS